MALLLTPLGNNSPSRVNASATISCTGCKACLTVRGVSPVALRVLVEQMEPVHQCVSSAN